MSKYSPIISIPMTPLTVTFFVPHIHRRQFTSFCREIKVDVQSTGRSCISFYYEVTAPYLTLNRIRSVTESKYITNDELAQRPKRRAIQLTS